MEKLKKHLLENFENVIKLIQRVAYGVSPVELHVFTYKKE